MMKNVIRSVLAGALAAGSLGLVSIPAQAAVPTNYCNGKSYSYLIKTYDRGSEKLALRCGTSSWGFNHITARWNSTFDSEIALTISRGERVDDYQGDGGSAIYALFDGRCNELFRVIYNGRAYNGNGVSPQGIITAYERSGTITTAVPNTASTNATPAYRTDCSVNQNI